MSPFTFFPLLNLLVPFMVDYAFENSCCGGLCAKERRVQKVRLSHLHAGDCEVTDCYDPSRIEFYTLQGRISI